MPHCDPCMEEMVSETVSPLVKISWVPRTPPLQFPRQSPCTDVVTRGVRPPPLGLSTSLEWRPPPGGKGLIAVAPSAL